MTTSWTVHPHLMMELEDPRPEIEMPEAEDRRQEAMAVDMVEMMEDREDRLAPTLPVMTFLPTLTTMLEMAELGAQASQID